MKRASSYSRVFGRALAVASTVLLAALASGAPASANNSWNGYHWARTSNPFTVQLVASVTNGWDAYLGTASTDWSVSSVLDTSIGSGLTDSKTRRQCQAVSGKVHVCNQTYGFNGWLGVAQIWVSGSHIVQGTAKMNDSYFNTATYNKPEWKRMVMCQEVGHTFGLAHQDETFGNANLGTCMDYTNNPAGPLSNEHPNTHDYDQLALIYVQTDSSTTVAAPAAAASRVPDEGGSSPAEWGQPVRFDAHGAPILYRRDLGGGQQIFTWVVWARGVGPTGR